MIASLVRFGLGSANSTTNYIPTYSSQAVHKRNASHWWHFSEAEWRSYVEESGSRDQPYGM